MNQQHQHQHPLPEVPSSSFNDIWTQTVDTHQQQQQYLNTKQTYTNTTDPSVILLFTTTLLLLVSIHRLRHTTTLQQQQQQQQKDIMTNNSSSSSTVGDDTGVLLSPKDVRVWIGKQSVKQLKVLDKFLLDLRLGRLNDKATPYGTTDRLKLMEQTVQVLQLLIGQTKWNHPASLLTILKGLGLELSQEQKREPAIANLVKRIMCIVRLEVDTNNHHCCIDEDTPTTTTRNNNTTTTTDTTTTTTLSLSSMLWAHPEHFSASSSTTKRLRTDSFSSVDDSAAAAATSKTKTNLEYPKAMYQVQPHFRQAIMEALQEIKMELEDIQTNIERQATDHVHAGEIILTYGRSRTVEYFLKAAAKKCQFKVIVCEGAPHYGGHTMAKSLAKAGIDTTVIFDSATFALMARVNKVLVPAHAVLANGGLIAPSGTHMVALSAQQNSVPLVVLTAMFKLCPTYPHEGQDTLQDLVAPSYCCGNIPDHVELVNPVHDYIPPQLINLYVTNIGAFQPSYTYRLLAEYYHTDDWDAFE